MTTERETVSLGSCPTCGGPAQFIEDTCPTCGGDGWTADTTADPLPSGEPGEPYQVQRTCDDCGGPGRLASLVREVRLPNIDEDLGGGWRLTDIYRMLQERPARTWRAGAQDRGRLPDVEYGWGDSPASAYLALRRAIEARR